MDRIGRKGGKPELMGKATRSYNMVWGVGAPTYAWFGSGTAYAARLAIATSYAGVDPQLLQHMLTADGVDLRDALNVLRDGTEDVSVGGLCDMPYLGLQNEDADDLGNIYVEHVFTIHYHQATDA